MQKTTRKATEGEKRGRRKGQLVRLSSRSLKLSSTRLTASTSRPSSRCPTQHGNAYTPYHHVRSPADDSDDEAEGEQNRREEEKVSFVVPSFCELDWAYRLLLRLSHCIKHFGGSL